MYSGLLKDRIAEMSDEEQQSFRARHGKFLIECATLDLYLVRHFHNRDEAEIRLRFALAFRVQDS